MTGPLPACGFVIFALRLQSAAKAPLRNTVGPVNGQLGTVKKGLGSCKEGKRGTGRQEEVSLFSWLGDESEAFDSLGSLFVSRHD